MAGLLGAAPPLPYPPPPPLLPQELAADLELAEEGKPMELPATSAALGVALFVFLG